MPIANDSQKATMHTVEPWRITGQSCRDYEGAEIGTANKTVAVILTADAVEATEEERANGNRICAAVNACQGISTKALELGVVSKLLAALIDLIEQLEGIGIPDWHGAEGLCLEQARAAIAEAGGRSSPEPRKPIVIEVHGGVVQKVRNVPPGYQYEIKDYDSLKAAEVAAGQQQSPLDKWLEKSDMPQEAGTSEPTNRDRARWAGDALAVFTDATFSGDYPDTMHRPALQRLEPAGMNIAPLFFVKRAGAPLPILPRHYRLRADLPFISDHGGGKNVNPLVLVTAVPAQHQPMRETPGYGCSGLARHHPARYEFAGGSALGAIT